MKLIVNYKKNVMKLFSRRNLNFSQDYSRLRFFVRKTLKYGELIRLKFGKTYLNAYHTHFYYGFSMYVIIYDVRKPKNDESNIYAVMLENTEVSEFSKRLKMHPRTIMAVDWFYPS